MYQKIFNIETNGKGLYEFTHKLASYCCDLPQTGILSLFLPHTSASLIIQENADPTAKVDLEHFLNRLIPDGEAWHEHTLEGEDDTSAHMKAAITNSSLLIPIVSGKIALGIWQGVYLWEHRKQSHQRKIILSYW